MPLLACQLAACSFPDVPFPNDPGPTGDPSHATCDDQACAQLGGECRSSDDGRVCLLPDAPCALLTESVCSANAVHECRQGLTVATAHNVCHEFEQCYQASYTRTDGESASFAHCAVDPAPCSSESVGECRGNVAVQCGHGFPIYEQRCDGKRRCAEYAGTSGIQLAKCVDDVTCPSDVSPQIQPIGIPLPFACDRDALIYCESTVPFPFIAADCTLYGEHCSTGGITTCTVSESGPAAPQWRSVPAGHFTPNIGLSAGVPSAVAAFEMLRTEVTLGQYDQCVRAGGCSGSFGCEPPTHRGDVPLPCSVATAAAQYCGWLGARLPTAAEWEYAARNAGEDVAFPWGDDAGTCTDIGFREGSRANGCTGEPAVGCSHARDVTAQGICDLAGNLTEWVAPVDPGGASERGRSYAESWNATTLGGTDAAHTSGGEATIGFRCVR